MRVQCLREKPIELWVEVLAAHDAVAEEGEGRNGLEGDDARVRLPLQVLCAKSEAQRGGCSAVRRVQRSEEGAAQ